VATETPTLSHCIEAARSALALIVVTDMMHIGSRLVKYSKRKQESNGQQRIPRKSTLHISLSLTIVLSLAPTLSATGADPDVVVGTPWAMVEPKYKTQWLGQICRLQSEMKVLKITEFQPDAYSRLTPKQDTQTGPGVTDM
jgi:hypothetical protein